MDRTYKARGRRLRKHYDRLVEKYGAEDDLTLLAYRATRKADDWAGKESRPHRWWPRERIVPLLKRYIEEHNTIEYINAGTKCGGMDALEAHTGIQQRRIFGFLRGWETTRGGFRGETKFISIDTVDKLFVGMNLTHLFVLPPEQGGFSDLYFHPSVFEQAEKDLLLEVQAAA